MASRKMASGAAPERAGPALARRLAAAATAIMPPSRRDWGKAISAELDYARSHGDSVRLGLSAARIALLPPPGLLNGLRVSSTTAGLSAVLAAIAYVPLGAGLFVSNVIIRPGDSSGGDLLMWGYLLFTLLAVGALARRASPRISMAIIAGLAAGAVIGALQLATFAWLDNAFFSVISQQQEKIASFRESGMTSMHAYLNGQLVASALGIVIAQAVTGAIFAPVGAALAGQLAQASSHASRLVHGKRQASRPG
jgi:hypothetical protein